MVPRFWFGLLLTLLLPPSILAQPPHTPRTGPRVPPPDTVIIRPVDIDSERPSHRLLDNGLDRNLRPEDALAARLRDPRQLKLLRDQFDDRKTQGDITRLARQLLNDEKFLDSLRGKYSRQDLERLLGNVGGSSGIGSDPALQRFLREMLEGNTLSRDQENLFRRWSEKLRENGVTEPVPTQPPQPTTPEPPTTPPTPPPTTTPNQPPTPSPLPNVSTESPNWNLDPQTRDWMRRNLDRWTKDLDRWLDSPSGQNWRDSFRNFTQRMQQNTAPPSALVEQARGLSRYLPRPSNFLPRSTIRRLPEATLPSLPRFGVPSAPRLGGAASFASSGKLLLWLALLAVVGVLLWKWGGWIEQVRQARASQWHLGPWPVRPGAVRTRGDLVRAFEHLALLCLGLPARTQHHLDLADQIGRQPSLDPDRRREAAQTLALLYEHARYLPESDPMPEEELRRARRELSYLAGESAA